MSNVFCAHQKEQYQIKSFRILDLACINPISQQLFDRLNVSDEGKLRAGCLSIIRTSEKR